MGTMPCRKRRNGRAAFRAVESEVRAALSAGWTLIAIYEEKRTRLGMSYAQFARYAQPFREAMRGRNALAVTAARKVAEQTSAAAPERKQAQTTKTDGPPKGRPEEAVPTLDMDGFAAKALKNEDLF